MLKGDIIEQICADVDVLTRKDVGQSVNIILETMTKALINGQRIEIRGFGSFALNYRPPRQSRNPKSGDPVQVPAKYLPHFKVGKELRERVDYADDRHVPHRAVE